MGIEVKVVKETLPVCVCKGGENIKKEVEVRNVYITLPPHYIPVEEWERKIEEEKNKIENQIKKLKGELRSLDCERIVDINKKVECLAKRRVIEESLKEMEKRLQESNGLNGIKHFTIIPNGLIEGICPNRSHIRSYVDLKRKEKVDLFSLERGVCPTYGFVDVDTTHEVRGGNIQVVFIGKDIDKKFPYPNPNTKEKEEGEELLRELREFAIFIVNILKNVILLSILLSMPFLIFLMLYYLGF